MSAQPQLRAILAEARLAEPDLDFETWRTTMTDGQKQFAWPSRTEAGRAWLVWQLMNYVADGCASAATTYQIRDCSRRFRVPDTSMPVSARGQNDYVVKSFVKQVFRPFFHYLSDQVSRESAVVHVLQRYVACVQIFDYRELHQRYLDAVKDQHVGEDVYDIDLQRFLFLDAGYITHAKAQIASGQPDLVGGLHTDDPLVCEGKLYDGDGRAKSYLVNGFHQVWLAANNYNKTVAYLVVFNLTDKRLQFESDGQTGAWAPCIEYAGIRVHIIVVRAHRPAKTDSKAGRPKTVVITRIDLITFIEEDEGAADHERPPARSGI